MANLQVQLGDLLLQNPVMLGSATPTWDGEHSKKGYESGASAVVPKTICLGEDHYTHPQNGRFVVLKNGGKPFGMINVEIFTTLPESAWLKKELYEAKKNGAKIIASTLAMESPEDTAQLIRNVESTGLVDAFELNNSCPMHISMNDFNIVPMTVEQTSAARKATNLPLLVKFPSTVTSLTDALKASEACGADGVVISNSARGFAGLDIHTATPYFGTMGGYSGAAIKPLIQPMIIDAAKAINIPIVAVGGINRWEDIVEYIMLGATAVQVVSTVMWQGYGCINSMVDKMSKFMDEHGYTNITEMRGIALPKIGSYDSILHQPAMAAEMDPALCTGCGKCVNTCFYDAISIENKKAIVNRDKCDGCGLCVQLCPFQAAQLTDK